MADKPTQAEINRRVAECLPAEGWNVTVAIVIANPPSVYLLGTGTLFEIAGDRFVVTAAHVVADAYIYNRTIGISDGQDSFVSVHGDWIVSAKHQRGGVEDPFDIAVYRLPPDAVLRLNGKRFLRRENIDFDELPPSTVFSLFGFPGMWAEPSRVTHQKVSVKALEYTTYTYGGPTESLLGYNARYHLLLCSAETDITNADGSPTVVVRKDGQLAVLPRDLVGMSGCSVWAVGDFSLPLARWDETAPKVVAVETGIYHGSQVIRATRWSAVATLIYEAFSELRPVLRLWEHS